MCYETKGVENENKPDCESRGGMVLTLCLCAALSGCGGKTSGAADAGTETDSSADSAGEQLPETTETPEIALEDSQAKLIYAKDNYAVAAFYGPDGGDSVNADFCDAEGNSAGVFCGTGTLKDGWQLVVSREFPKGYDYSGIGVIIEDVKAERDADGKYPSKTILNIEQMSEDEMRELGIDFLDGHACIVGDGGTTYGNWEVGIECNITWFDDMYFEDLRTVDGFTDHFSFFAGDGTPLEDYFEGYSTLEVEPLITWVKATLKQDGDTADEAKNKSMCDELNACNPYMIYTGLDGTEQRFELLTYYRTE